MTVWKCPFWVQLGTDWPPTDGTGIGESDDLAAGGYLRRARLRLFKRGYYLAAGGRISRGGTLNASASFHMVRSVIDRPASMRW